MMKKLTVTFVAILFCYISSGQVKITDFCSKSEVKSLEGAVSYYWKWNTDDDPIKAVLLLEEFSNTYKDNWVGQYWAAYISTQIANSIQDKSDEYLGKAQVYLDESVKRFNKNQQEGIEPYFRALQSLIYRLKSFSSKNSKEQSQNFLNKAKEELNNAIKASPENPVVMVMAATNMGNSHNGNFSLIIGAIALLEKAKLEFNKIKDRSPADITYWNEHWIDPWLKNLSPPKKTN